MTARTSLLSILITGALASSFSACSSSTEGLFSPAGGASSTGGTSVSAAGGSAVGGHPATGGNSSTAGSTAAAGTNASGGSDANGGHANGGAGSVAGTSSAGTTGDAGGSGNAGTSAGGGNAAGTDAGGNAGTSNAGTSSGGSGGSSAGAGGNGGGGGTPSCEDLMALAESELAAARACDNSHNVEQCTGKVSTTCGCQVPVESSDSEETKAYLVTLKRFQDQHCVIACAALVCPPIQHAQCQSQGSSTGMCIGVAGPVTQ